MGDSHSVSTFHIDKLNYNNYDAWSYKTQMYLMKEKCWEVVSKTTAIASGSPEEKEDLKAWNLIGLLVEDSQLIYVRTLSSGRAAWNKLKEVHLQATLTSQVRIMRFLLTTKLEQNGDMTTHLQKVFERFGALVAIGKPLDEDMKVCILLASLNEDYGPMITALEAWDETKRTVEAVRAKLMEEYSRKSSEGEAAKTDDIAMRTFRRKFSEPPTCYGCNKRGHIHRDCRTNPWRPPRRDDRPGEGDNRPPSSGNVAQAHAARFAFSARKVDTIEKRIQMRTKFEKRLCYNCHGRGHSIADCPSRPAVRSEIVKVNESMNKMPESAKMSRLRKYYSTSLKSLNHEKSIWLADSGASDHMSCDKIFFENLTLGVYGKITIANGESLKAEGIGTVKLTVGEHENPVELTLKDVLYIPTLSTNLLSIRKITQNKLRVLFDNDECKIVSNDNNRYVIAKYISGGYQLSILHKNRALVGTSEHEKGLCVHEWHRKLAHRHLGDVRKMTSLGIVFKKCFCSDFCHACVKGKTQRKPFPPSTEKFQHPLDCVSSDLCGPMDVESVGRSRYLMTFNDLFSGYTEVTFLRKKSDAAEHMIQFIEKIKTKFGRKVKMLRTDQGGEYRCKKLQDYLKAEGIEYQCTVAFSPQQNSHAERKNRTLVEAARTMLRSTSLPQKYWAEAIHHANHVFNRIPNANGITPYELFLNYKPKLDFHEFGSDVYVMIPYQRRRKLDDKAEIAKFLSWDNHAKGYRVVDAQGVIRISRDLTFVPATVDAFQTVSLECEDEFEEEQQDKTSENEDVTPKVEIKNEQPDESIEETFVEIANEPIIIHSSQPHFGRPAPAFDGYFEPEHDVTLTAPENLVISVSDSSSNGSFYESTAEQTPPPTSNTRVTRSKSRAQNENHKAMMTVYKDDPLTFKQAIESEDSDHWMKAMKKEMESLVGFKTWCLTKLPENRKAIGCKWVFKTKRNENGEISRYKARLVAQGFSQKYGVDYNEVFAPVGRSTTFKIFMSFAGSRNYVVKNFDFDTAFLNGILKEEIYMQQPEGFQTGENDVCKLQRSIYGLRQSARVWNQALHEILVKLKFVQSEHDKCLYVLSERENFCYLLVHVDDIVMASKDTKLIDLVERQISQKFKLKDLGRIRQFLGIDVSKDESGNFHFSQKRYIHQIVEAAGLVDARESKYPLAEGYFKLDHNSKSSVEQHKLYRKLIGMLLYLANHSRPDISASVSILSQHVNSPSQTDMNELKRIIRYLKKTKDLELKLNDMSLSDHKLECFSDANWAEDRETRKSNTGYFFKLNGGAISWCCRKQNLVTLSSTEAEYVALAETCKEAIWIQHIVNFFEPYNETCLTINTDSQSCIKMVQNDKFSNNTKHIDTRLHFIKDLVRQKKVQLKYVPTTDNIADLFTKPLGPTRIEYLRKLACLTNVTTS